MKIKGQHFRTIWPNGDGRSFSVIDQTLLPHHLEVRIISNLEAAADAIRTMVVRGAPLIGVTAAYGVAVAMTENDSDQGLQRALKELHATRPTAVNLHWTLARTSQHLAPLAPELRRDEAWRLAAQLADEDVAINQAIGSNGRDIITRFAKEKSGPVKIATHCNAGWLATVDWGTALAPVYSAFDSGIDLHVFADETRPRLQGAALTAFELREHGVPFTIVPDGASGHVMRREKVDAVIVGCDRVAANGDTANKIGTYMQALAAKDNGIPFYVALPSRTVDLSLAHGDLIEIEHRSQDEVLFVNGPDGDGRITRVNIATPGATATNPAFDVTPARLVTGYITELGVLKAEELSKLARA